jgi:hypothetical protein
MRRPPKQSPLKLSADGQRLVNLAVAMARASSRLEERAWENQLDALIEKLLKSHHQDTVNAALDHLFRLEAPAYDALIDCVEAVSSSCTLEQDGKPYDALLIALPLLAWTRFSIASGPVAPDLVEAIASHLRAHLLADGARLSLSPLLYSIDQLPQTHADTYALTQRMARASLVDKPMTLSTAMPETVPFLADTRYLLATVIVPSGDALFQWQCPPLPISIAAAQAEALRRWQIDMSTVTQRLLPGCGVELLMPEAYYLACREADKRIRPVSIRAAINYLTQTLESEPSSLAAVIGGFAQDSADRRIDEYRISFTLQGQTDVIYGVVWPLYGQEEADEESFDMGGLFTAAPSEADEFRTPLEEILALLRECGVTDIKIHRELFQSDFCEDCGTPLYVDWDAELVHAEMPEDVPQGPQHLH